ncbi:Transcription factor iws1 [Basidiobolus ranarum]|uniref:Transcription factor iws1 n=1 Tax=Basidiobolus ranarum TaxID=34480 RepID=A0ABR2X2B5_9FUNG
MSNNEKRTLESEIFGNSDEEDLSDLDKLDKLSDEDEPSPARTRVEDEPKETHSSLDSLPSFRRKREGSPEQRAERPRIERQEKPRRRERDDRDEEREYKRRDRDDDDEHSVKDPKQALLDEVRRDFDAALASMNGRKKKSRKDEEDLDERNDDMIVDLRERMKQAAYSDIEANNERKPAIAKIRILPQVMIQLRKSNLHEAFVENHILEPIKMWLEPLPDGALSSLDIQTEMLQILDKLPIRTENLRESGVGRIVMFFTKTDRVTQRIRRLAEALVDKWSRPILRRSQNYRDRLVREAAYEQEESYASPSVSKGGNFGVDGRKPVDLQPGDLGYSVSARIPQSLRPAYDVLPKSNIRADSRNKGNDKYRKLKNHMSRFKGGPKKNPGPKVSIEGKNIAY